MTDETVAAATTSASYTVEVRVRAVRSALGLIDHYYMILGDREYHPGMYAPGSILAKGTTKGYHVAAIRTICQTCYDKIILNFNAREDKRIWSLFPILNCESFSTGVSMQSMMLVTVPLALTLFAQRHFLYAIIVALLGVILHLAVSKFTFSRTIENKCAHLT